MVIRQHLQHGLTNPLVVVSWGSGTETYRGPFLDGTRFARWLKAVEEKLIEHGAPKTAKVGAIGISAYGGGYGAVREILKNEDQFKMIHRIVLCDAVYASYVKDESSADRRKLVPENVDPWIPFMKAAAKGEKTFALTFSQVVTRGYASCAECADAFAEIVGAPMEPVELDSCPAANDDDFPLIKRSDVGHFYQWGYDGANDSAHLVHLQHLGDVWKVLDEAGAP